MLHFGRVSKVKRGWSAARKIIVFALAKRKAQLKAMPILVHERSSVMLQIPTKALKGLCRTQTNGKHSLNVIYTDTCNAVFGKAAKGKRPVGREHIHVLKACKSCPQTSFMLSPRRCFRFYLIEGRYCFKHRKQGQKILLLKLSQAKQIFFQNIKF